VNGGSFVPHESGGAAAAEGGADADAVAGATEGTVTDVGAAGSGVHAAAASQRMGRERFTRSSLPSLIDSVA
jgi:hypothetical protein